MTTINLRGVYRKTGMAFKRIVDLLRLWFNANCLLSFAVHVYILDRYVVLKLISKKNLMMWDAQVEFLSLKYYEKKHSLVVWVYGKVTEN